MDNTKGINELFFELIRVSIGTLDSLSYIPKPKEWKALYDMAKKQSLVGVCFAALQRLGADADEGFARIGISEMQYLTWMGMTAKIQQRNEVVNLEALACGTPVITYKTGGSPEAVDSNTGCVIKQGDLNALCAKIQEFNTTGFKQLHSADCRKRAEEHFDKDKCFERYIQLYEQLISQ